MVVVGILAMELVMFVLPSFTSVSLWSSLSNTAEVLSGALNAFTNEERTANGLPALKANDTLARAAELKALHMATNGYFAHTSPDGKTPWYWLDLVGYPYQYAGENLAINFNDSKDVTIAWMNSPGHRANIVKGAYTEVGTGIASGTYQGREAVFVAQVYANPYRKEKAAAAPAASTSLSEVAPAAPIEDLASSDEAVLSATAEGSSALLEATEETMPAEASVRISFLERMMVSPQHAARGVLVALLALVVVALALKVFIRPRIQHRDLITNGLMLVAVLAGVFLLNDMFSAKNVVLTQTTEYAAEEQRF